MPIERKLEYPLRKDEAPGWVREKGFVCGTVQLNLFCELLERGARMDAEITISKRPPNNVLDAPYFSISKMTDLVAMSIIEGDPDQKARYLASVAIEAHRDDLDDIVSRAKLSITPYLQANPALRLDSHISQALKLETEL